MLPSRSSRPWLLVALAGVAVLVTAGLAGEAWRATERHRLAATAALHDHARFAALTLRQQYVSRAWIGTDGIFRHVAHARITEPREALPGPEVMRQAADRLARCDDCEPVLVPRYFFRVMVADSSLDVEGPPLSGRRRALLLHQAFHFRLPAEWQDWDYASFADTLDGRPDLVYLTVRRDSSGAPLAVYGFAASLDAVTAAYVRPGLDRLPLLPVPAGSRLTNDSLLSVSLLRDDGTAGAELSPKRLPDTYAVRLPASRFLGSWTLRVALDPDVAPRLLVGGLPRTRAPLLLALVLAAALLLLATAAVAWRALELADLRAEFVASVSHELRTPLAQILLFGESLGYGTMRSRRDVRVAGRVVVGEARRLLGLVDNVLRFGRPASGVDVPARAEPLAPLVQDVITGFTPVARAAESRVVAVRLDDVEAPADRGAIRQVLLNLLDNAVKYGPRGQTVSIGLALAGDRARLWVEDQGPGIPAADRARAWRPFVRLARDVDRQTAGSGIGLSLVRDIVARHRGSAVIESTPAGGARVVVELPHARPLPSEVTCAS